MARFRVLVLTAAAAIAGCSDAPGTDPVNPLAAEAAGKIFKRFKTADPKSTPLVAIDCTKNTGEGIVVCSGVGATYRTLRFAVSREYPTFRLYAMQNDRQIVTVADVAGLPENMERGASDTFVHIFEKDPL
jgi:hypothetical protein